YAKERTLCKEESSSGRTAVPSGTIRPLPRAPTKTFVSGNFAKCFKASAPIPEVAPVITIFIVTFFKIILIQNYSINVGQTFLYGSKFFLVQLSVKIRFSYIRLMLATCQGMRSGHRCPP